MMTANIIYLALFLFLLKSIVQNIALHQMRDRTYIVFYHRSATARILAFLQIWPLNSTSTMDCRRYLERSSLADSVTFNVLMRAIYAKPLNLWREQQPSL